MSQKSLLVKIILRATVHLQLKATFTGLEMTLLRNVSFWSFLTKSKQDLPPPSQVHEKIWPHSSRGYDYWVQNLLSIFFEKACV